MIYLIKNYIVQLNVFQMFDYNVEGALLSKSLSPSKL